MKALRPTRPIPASRQHGAVLVVSLLILLVMTLIGLSAMQTTTLEERMAGNARDQNLAFQASEAGIRDAEALTVANSTGVDWLTGAGTPLLTLADPEPDPLLDATWAGADSQAYSGTALTDIKTQPRFFMKHTGTYDYVYSGQGIGGKAPPVQVDVFRITSRGTGGSDNAEVVLRSNWGRVRLR